MTTRVGQSDPQYPRRPRSPRSPRSPWSSGTVGHATGTLSPLEERFCPRCGHRGPELQGPRGVTVFACRACGEDLYSRPARSYLEMEGIVDERKEILRFVARAAQKPEPRIRRLRRRLWSHASMRRVVFGAMFAVASLGTFLLVSLAAVAVLS